MPAGLERAGKDCRRALKVIFSSTMDVTMAIMPMAWLMVKISPNTVMLMIVAMTGSAKVRTAALPVSM